MMIFNLADGGRIAINPADVAAATASPWGSTLFLAYDRVKFEVEDKMEQVASKLPHLILHGPGLIANPRQISSVWEVAGDLRMTIRGGLSLTQSGFNLNEFTKSLDTMAKALTDFDAKGKAPRPGSPIDGLNADTTTDI